MKSEPRRHPFLVRLALAALALTGATAADADVGPAPTRHVRAELIAESSVLAPGLNTLALRLTPEPGWHTYWRNPGQVGKATELRWTLPAGFESGPIRWPTPRVFHTEAADSIGYDETEALLVDLRVPAAAAGQTVDLVAEARWLACSDTCVPERAELHLTRPIATEADPTPDPAMAEVFAQARRREPAASSLAARYEVAGSQLRLELRGHDLHHLERGALRFLPYEELVTRAFTPTAIEHEADRLVLTLPLEADATIGDGGLGGLLMSADGKAINLLAQAGAVPPATPAAAADAPSFLLVLLLAFLGGLVLNLMPCVFPVLSIKAVSLMQGAHDAGEQRRHALVYTAGVLGSFTLAAGVLLLLRAGGAALGWGFQLQSPWVVGLLAYLMFAMGLSLSGAVHFGGSLMGMGQNLANRHGYAGSFFTGVLAVIVASPCTAPFMGTALGFAMTQPWPLALTVFAMLGLGLASPFLVLAWWPAAARWLPRPGAWMETFKQAMAFPLYFTVVWLLWVLGRQAGLTALLAALCGLVFVSLAAWGLSGYSAWRRNALAPVAALLALALLALPAQTVVPATSGTAAESAAAGGPAWEAYTPARLAELRAAGRTVFVDLTADWCLTCKVNERVALDVESTRALFARENVALLRGDWTRADPAITALLERHGRNGVPLYLVYTAGTAEAVVLPQLLTPGIVAAAFPASSSR